jgi:MFS family permease
LSWTQYSILASPHHILVQHFGLTSPLSSGLFYIAPATGFLVGTIVGGRYSDMTVRRFIKLRGERLPQDRLNSGMWSFFLVIPAASLISGWGLQYCDSCTAAKEGLALPIVTAFFAAAGLLAAFASLNTYCTGKFNSSCYGNIKLTITQKRYPGKDRKLSLESTLYSTPSLLLRALVPFRLWRLLE